MTSVMTGMQHLGRSLMLPIAVLPVASLLLRLGQPDLLDIPFVAAAGQAIFSNLGLLFAIGVAVGFAQQNHGAAGLAGVVAFFVATKGAQALIGVPPELLAGLSDAALAAEQDEYTTQALAKMSVPIGILSGILSGLLYNRFWNIRLPEYLAFFGGRRFVPIASGCAGLLLALVFGYGWNGLETGIDLLSRWIVDAGEIGLFLYGALNRLLIVTGLHHVLNNVAWFIVGEYQGATGDLMRFFAGDPEAGAFMSGFFPVMMFGLPAACLAMYHAAERSRRKAAGGMLLSMALTSFLTGVTEPIEFSFMFLAPVLYGVHAVLTGISMALMDSLGAKLGFGFSAGLFDYILNFTQSSRPLLLPVVGALYFGVYYAAFRAFIHAFDLKTPGRESVPQSSTSNTGEGANGTPQETKAAAFIRALGGSGNLESVSACTTRLRLRVRDQSAVDEAALRALGASGVLHLSDQGLQVVVGTTADMLATDMQGTLAEEGGGAGYVKSESVSATPAPELTVNENQPAFEVSDLQAFLVALGGRENICSAEPSANRVCLTLADDALADVERLTRLGVRAVARLARGRVHLLLPRNAERLAASLSGPVD